MYIGFLLKYRITNILAIDCEMVEVDNLYNGLARITIVNYNGDILLDSFCKPEGEITNYRYEITGITEKTLENAVSYEKCRQLALNIIKNKIIVGHSIDNDLLVLNHQHPYNLIRDTAKFKKFQQNTNRMASLKALTEQYFGIKIQNSTHDSVLFNLLILD